jgi:hypothetical protein
LILREQTTRSGVTVGQLRTAEYGHENAAEKKRGRVAGPHVASLMDRLRAEQVLKISRVRPNGTCPRRLALWWCPSVSDGLGRPARTWFTQAARERQWLSRPTAPSNGDIFFP